MKFEYQDLLGKSSIHLLSDIMTPEMVATVSRYSKDKWDFRRKLVNIDKFLKGKLEEAVRRVESRRILKIFEEPLNN